MLTNKIKIKNICYFVPKRTLINTLIIIFTFMIFLFTDSKTCGAQSNYGTIEPGVLTIGTNATLKPFEYIDEQNEIVGFDVDLIKKIAGRLNLKIKLVDMEFTALISAIENRKIDIAVAAITKNEEREKIVNFTEPYYISNQVVLTTNEQKLEKESDFKGKIIAAQQGTVSQNTIESLIDEKKIEINLKTYSDYMTMYSDLLNSRIDAIVLDMDTGKAYENLNKSKLKLINGSQYGWEDEKYCIACSKQNVSLLNDLNSQIESLKNDPFYENLKRKYMNNSNHMDADVAKLNSASTENENKLSIYEQFKTSFLNNNRWTLYLKGLGVTLQITVFAAILGIAIGIILAIFQTIKLKKLSFLNFFFRLYIDLIRGTPLLLQLFILWFALMKNSKHPILVAIISCGINSSAYVCEIVRSAINSIDKGQTEAGLAMGFSHVQTLALFVLPQGLKNSIPALCNEAISLLKETAIVGYIAIIDLTRAADQIRAATYLSLMPLIIAAAIYFTLTKIASILLGLLERKL